MLDGTVNIRGLMNVEGKLSIGTDFLLSGSLSIGPKGILTFLGTVPFVFT